MSDSTLASNENRLERIIYLARIDFIKRYYESKFGVFWALLNPLFRIVIYYTLFGVLRNENIPNYGIYLFIGIIFWSFFTETSSKGLKLFRSKLYLIESFQISSIDFFLASIISSSLGLAFNFSALILTCLVFQVDLSLIGFVYLPIFFFVFALLGLGTSLILATVDIYFKDINHIWDMVKLLGFWFSPIILRGSVYTDNIPYYNYIHPFAASIDGLRSTLLYGNSIEPIPILINLIFAIALTVGGYFLVKKFSYKASEIL